MKIKIYCLYEPHTCKIRYVGRTKSDLKKRLREHISKAKNNYSNSHKENWIRFLLKNGIKPKIKLLVELDCNWLESHIFEKTIIQKHLLRHKLVNGDDRGPGNLSKNIDVFTEKERIRKLKVHFNKEENKNNFYNPIYCYDSSGKFFKDFKSVRFASEEFGVSKTKISNHTSRSSPNSIDGFYFRSFKTDFIIVTNKYSNIYKPIIIYDKQTGENFSFKSLSEFANNFSLNHWDLHQYRNNIKTKRFLEIEKLYEISPLQ